jgi:hypothetical protein
MEFTISDALTIEAIKGYKNVGKHEVAAMQSIANKFIDPKCVICNYCAAQIRFWHKRICDFAANNNDAIQLALNPQPIEEPKKRGRKPKTEE